MCRAGVSTSVWERAMAQDPGSDLLGAGVGFESVTHGMAGSSVAQGFHPTVAFTHNHDTRKPGVTALFALFESVSEA